MSNITIEMKVFGGIIIATIVLIVGAIFFFGNSSSATNDSTQHSKISSDILIRKDSWTEGPANAKVTMVEFGDFQCPACKAEQPIIEKVLASYPNKIHFVWRNFPLTQVHEFAMNAALAAEAAGKQGKFWPYHNELFKISPDLPNDKLINVAKDLGLNVDQFNSDLNSDAVRQRVLNDQADGSKAQVSGTPTIYINNVQLVNNSDPNSLPQEADFKQAIDPLLK